MPLGVYILTFFVGIIAASWVYAILNNRETRVAVAPVSLSDWAVWVTGVLGLGISLCYLGLEWGLG